MTTDEVQARREAAALEALEIAEELIRATIHRLSEGDLNPDEIAALLGSGPDLTDDANTPSAYIRLILEESQSAREADEVAMLKRRATLEQLKIIGQVAANVATIVGMFARSHFDEGDTPDA